MKKLRNTLLSAGILLTLAACSSGAPATEEETAAPVAAAADYVGSWQADRATLIIEESGDDEYTATIHWGSSYNEAAEYEYKVYYDEVSAGLSASKTAQRNTSHTTMTVRLPRKKSSSRTATRPSTSRKTAPSSGPTSRKHPAKTR